MTKEYNVGDTVYAKGKIIQVNESDGKFPYCVSFSDSDFTRIIDMCHAWLEEGRFVELPAKPMLPKGVADELEQAKHDVGDFDNYIQAVIENKRNRYPHSSRYWYGPRESNTETLLNAWNNGYTVEKPKLYNLILDDNYNGKIICLSKLIVVDELWVAYDRSDIDLKRNENYQFTQEEIDKYNKNFWIKSIDLNDYKMEVNIDD